MMPLVQTIDFGNIPIRTEKYNLSDEYITSINLSDENEIADIYKDVHTQQPYAVITILA